MKPSSRIQNGDGTIFYEMSHPLPKKFNSNSLFPDNSNVHGQHCPLTCAVFKPLFIPNFVDWGAIGIIHEKRANSFEYEYKWHFFCENDSTGTLRKSIDKFANKIKKHPEQYYLLGNIAEDCFYESSGVESLPCFGLIEDDIKKDRFLRISKWFRVENFNAAIQYIKDKKDKEKAWKKYNTEIKKIVSGSIIYIPAINHHRSADNAPILAGGLLWGIKKGNLKIAVKHMAEAQLFFRWLISILLDIYPGIGRSSDPVSHIINALDTSYKDIKGWASGNMHDATPAACTILRKQFEFLKEQGVEDKFLHEGVKAVMLDNKAYCMPSTFLLALMKYVNKKMEISVNKKMETSGDAVDIPINASNNNNFAGKRGFLTALLIFVKCVPEEDQKWVVAISKVKDICYITMQVVGGGRGNLNIKKLDTEKKTGSSPLWGSLKKSVAFVKYSEIKKSPERFGLSIGNDGKLVIFWKEINEREVRRGGQAQV